MTTFERYALFQLSHAHAPLLHRRYAIAIFTGLPHQLQASLHQDNTIWSIHSSIVMAGCQILLILPHKRHSGPCDFMSLCVRVSLTPASPHPGC